MRLGTEEIEFGPHVQRLAVCALRVALQQGEVERRTAAVARDRRDVALQQVGLVQVRIVRGLGAGIGRVRGPTHEVGDRARRAIAVVDAQALVAFAQAAFDPRQRFGDFALQVAARGLVTVDRGADEVVVAEIADVLRHVRHQATDVDHAGLLHSRRRRQDRRGLRRFLHARAAHRGEQQHRQRDLPNHSRRPARNRDPRNPN